MQYISTRGSAPTLDFEGVTLAGLASDGGLYLPSEWPRFTAQQIADMRGLPYHELAARVMEPFVAGSLTYDELSALCHTVYGDFGHKAVTPLVQMDETHWLLELFHGPTLAFKDVAMQFIGQLYDLVLSRKGARMSVVCATSGDTGGAAAAAFAGAQQVDLYILHPHERVSPIQRLFMTTTGAANVHNLAVDGDFDDCQALVKAMFADKAFASDVHLSGVNSINWARIAAQSVYYAAAQAALGPERPLRFVVPRGNMGDAFAGL